MDRIALVVGATGLTGASLTQELVADGWQTFGLARKPKTSNDGVHLITADLLDQDKLKEALKNINPTHVFITTWMRKDTEAENILFNGSMVRNLLEVLSEKKTVEHVALVTGLKHYLGPFEAFASKDNFIVTPLREEQPRLSFPNFYYAQEDEVYNAAQRDGFSWSIHRPHTVIGKAVGNLMNMGTTLAVYASICKHKGQKFIWPGSEAQWNGISDVTDAGLLAKQLIWAATTKEAKNKAFNVVNGDIFRWNWLWERIAKYFDIESEGFKGSAKVLEKQMRDDNIVWDALVKRHGLEENSLYQLASPWHTDLDLGRPIEVMTDMSNSRRLGFREYQNTEESFMNLFDRLREEKIIP
ncbi:SDR family oxidoreductase [Pedobacter sp. UYP1]|uniref:SDR family oxidoreductase n=1 Tax=Pedobacter sp. UYP1 TaxID=1756396 RepID=UPI003394BAA2